MLHSAKSKSINEDGLDLHQHEGEQKSGFKKKKGVKEILHKCNRC